MPEYLVEIVCQSVEDARNTALGGANRIELCTALDLGGLTPTPSLLAAVKSAVDLPVMAMVRPRPGGFIYHPDEIAVMERDAKILLENGADGLVFGFLTDQGTVDRETCARFIDLAQGRQTVFHRAFDCVADPDVALDTLIELGVTRILTSGLAATAEEGATVIAHLQQRSAGRIEILPGSGIRAHNARAILAATGTDQVHLAAKRYRSEPATFDFGNVSSVDPEMVRAVVAALR